MCGIVGYVGESQAAPLLLHGLSKLEYRGYDSAGIAVRNESTGDIQIIKAKGRLHALSEKTDDGHAVTGTCGIDPAHIILYLHHDCPPRNQRLPVLRSCRLALFAQTSAACSVFHRERNS